MQVHTLAPRNGSGRNNMTIIHAKMTQNRSSLFIE